MVRKSIKIIFVSLLLSLIICSVIPEKGSAIQPIDEGKVEVLLNQYSELLTGSSVDYTMLSNPLSSIIKERQEYYYDLFLKGFHSTLESIDSTFIVKTISYSDDNNEVLVNAEEILVLQENITYNQQRIIQ
jgi:hypothetical protein